MGVASKQWDQVPEATPITDDSQLLSGGDAAQAQPLERAFGEVTGETLAALPGSAKAPEAAAPAAAPTTTPDGLTAEQKVAGAEQDLSDAKVAAAAASSAAEAVSKQAEAQKDAALMKQSADRADADKKQAFETKLTAMEANMTGALTSKVDSRFMELEQKLQDDIMHKVTHASHHATLIS